MDRDGGTGSGACTWTSRWGSVAVTAWGAGTSDALNEAGLGAHLLYLEATGYGPDDGRPTLSNLRWVLWLVDTCASVDEAVGRLGEVRIVSEAVRGRELGVHLALEDAGGGSAVVELVEGAVVVHTGPDTAVLANDPTFDAQLANRARYRCYGGSLPPPGDILSTDRFVRASYFLGHLPEPTSYDEAVAGPILLARNVAVPPGAPYDDFSVYPAHGGSAPSTSPAPPTTSSPPPAPT